MSRSLNSHTGYLIIDHTDSPGITISEIPDKLKSTALVVKGGEIAERDTKSCSHCERQIILNPGRVRSRGICYHCHHYICDECDRMYRITGRCVPFKAVLDKALNQLNRNPNDPLITITG